MTPLIDRLTKVLPAWRGTWEQAITGIRSPRGLLEAIMQAEVYLMEEAEWETTALRQRHPDHYRTGQYLYLPADPCWIEFKAYGPDGRDTGQRTAFLATTVEGGHIRVFAISTGPFPNGVYVMALWDIDASMVRTPRQLEGQLLHVRSMVPGSEAPRQGDGINFFLELIETLNLPEHLIMETFEPRPATARRLAAELGARCTYKPFKAVTLALPAPREAVMAGVY